MTMRGEENKVVVDDLIEVHVGGLIGNDGGVD